MKTQRSWSVMMLVTTVMSPLITINGGSVPAAPAVYNRRALSRPMSFGGDSGDDERLIDQMYFNYMDSHQKRTDDGSAADSHAADYKSSLPKFHFEVHRVHHRYGHRTPTNEKLRDVTDHAAAGTGDDDDDVHDDKPLPANHLKKSTAASDNQLPHQFYPNDVISNNLQQHQQSSQTETDDNDDDDEAIDSAIFDRLLSESAEKKFDDVVEQDNEVPLADMDERSNVDELDRDTSELEEYGDGEVAQPLSTDEKFSRDSSISDVYFVAVIVGCSVAGLAGLLMAAVCWYRLHKKIKETSEVDYPAYGVTGPSVSSTNKDSRGGSSGSPGDRKLAQNAQMYHFQHQKQQMIASERMSHHIDTAESGGGGVTGSDVESDDENEDGDYTVFECPGLATAGEMEVRNPLFNDQPTPVTTHDVNIHSSTSSSHTSKK